MEKPVYKWRDMHHLVSAFPVFRRIDCVYAHKDKETGEVSISRDAIIGIQLYRTVSERYRVGLPDHVFEKHEEPALDYCFMRAPEDGSECGDVGPDLCSNILGYDIEGIEVTEEMWIRRAKRYFEKGGEQ